MIRGLALAACLAAPLPALALSCMPYDPVTAFEQASAAAELYVVVHGALDFDAAVRPRSHNDAPQSTSLPGHVTGMSLSRAGFTAPFDRLVTVTLHCFGPWCAGLGPGDDLLMFIEKRGSRYHLEVTPCTPHAFHAPTPRDLAAMTACLAGRCP